MASSLLAPASGEKVGILRTAFAVLVLRGLFVVVGKRKLVPLVSMSVVTNKNKGDTIS
jgi:hypothetical protein